MLLDSTIIKNLLLNFFLLLLPIIVIAKPFYNPYHTQQIPNDTIRFIDTILIVGNYTTKEHVILREMNLKVGSQITKELLEYDQNRIYSTGLFNKVHIETIPSKNNSAILVVTVHERWFIYPYPILGIKDRDWKKLYYGAGIIHINFRGRNEKISTSFALGYDPWIVFAYQNPAITSNFFLNALFAYDKVKNKSLKATSLPNNFDEYHLSFKLTPGVRFTPYQKAWITLGYKYVRVSPYYRGTTISTNGIDKFPIAALGYNYDTRDLIEYPSMGTFINISITNFGLNALAENLCITRYAADIRKYIPFSDRTTTKVKTFTNIAAGGKTPSYNRVFWGYDERIRGHFFKVWEGENIFGASAELFYTILKPIYYNIDFLPRQFGVWRFSITAAAFADAGTVWFRPQPFEIKTLKKGYGMGLHFLLPYSAVIRIEYAWNENRQGEIILDLGATF